MTESIGSKLKQSRESRHLSIAQVAEQTRVRSHYLEALENDDLSAIPSQVQARGFLRIYAEFLGLNLDELSARTRSAESQPAASSTASPVEPVPVPVPSSAPASDSRPHRSFFGSLRERWARHPAAEAVGPAVESSVPAEPAPEPEVFVPVRVHEELPAAAEEPVAAEPPNEPEMPSASPRVQRSSSRKTSVRRSVRSKAKKSSAKSTKSSKAVESGKARVKKKIAA
ncbi:MAG TPA: helix-turn-helix transcriptional regulator [Anaerolineales bacterium]|nr:helix-turn-helix transcriptional regulator [Anaerolineales bacterium]